jgi:D-methionine transport system ATP-binding protein
MVTQTLVADPTASGYVDDIGLAQPRGMIHYFGVTKIFEPRTPGAAPVHALADVTLHVDRGEIFGVIGRSGSGKSTLVRTTNLLERPTRGIIVVDGVELLRLDARALREQRRRIGMIFQHFNLLSCRTVMDNVALPLELAGMAKARIRERVLPLLDLVGLADKQNSYPAQLSGGQKQRVGIARALANEPAVLLCDEPTSALDPETTQQILRLLSEINDKLGLTIVLITHEMAVIKDICHRVAVLEHGRAIEQGDVFDVFIHPQHETTRSFVSAVTGGDLPEALARQLHTDRLPPGHAVLRVVFRGALATDPIISQLSRRFSLDLNLLYGRIDYIRGAPFGVIIVEASGRPEGLGAALTFLNSNDLRADILKHAPASLGADC